MLHDDAIRKMREEYAEQAEADRRRLAEKKEADRRWDTEQRRRDFLIYLIAATTFFLGLYSHRIFGF